MTGLPAMSFSEASTVSRVSRDMVMSHTERPLSAMNATSSPDENGATTRSPAAAGDYDDRKRADSSNDWNVHDFSPVA